MPALSSKRRRGGKRAALPLRIPNLALWLDASDASTITIATGVSQWNDKSGNGRNLTQGTAANQPARSSTLNGLNYVSFDGSNDSMSATWASVSNPITAFAVARITSNDPFAAPMGILGPGNLSGTTHTPLDVSAGGSTYRQYSSVVNSGGSATNNVWYYFTSQLNGASSFARANGSSIIGTANAGSATASTLYLGRDSTSAVFFPLDIGEIVYFTRALTADEIAAIELYLKMKWGL